MKRLMMIVIVGLGSMVPQTGAATVEEEIQHLLSYVRNSHVVFLRNGQEHNSAEAADHMAKKAKHFKDQIRTAEDFIRLAATKSLVSGELYSIRTPDGKTEKTGEWLTHELERFRNEKE